MEQVTLVLEFKKEVTFKNGYIAECRFPIGKQPEVMVTDIVKDTISERYENGKGETLTRTGNPKILKMNRCDFHALFKVTGIREITGYPFKK